MNAAYSRLEDEYELKSLDRSQSLKDCNIFQRACRLVRLRTLTITPKKSNEIFLKILFLPTGIFFLLRFCRFPLLFVNGKAE